MVLRGHGDKSPTREIQDKLGGSRELMLWRCEEKPGRDLPLIR